MSSRRLPQRLQPRLHQRLKPVALATLLALGASGLNAAPRTFTGGSSFWDVLTNWSGGILPGVGDDALLGAFDSEIRSGTFAINSFIGTGQLRLSGGILRVAAASSIGTLAMSNGTLGGAGTVTVGALNFGSGTMGESGNVFGTTTVTGATTFDGTLSQSINYGRTLNLNGDTNWSAGNGIIYVYSGGQGTAKLNIGSGTTFSDAGAASGTGTRNLGYFGDGQINNAGSYVRGGLGTTVVNAAFANTGTLNVNAGAMRFDGGNSSSSGNVNVAAGATLGFQGGTFNFTGGALANAGTWSVSGATVNVAAGTGYSGNGNVALSNGILRFAGAASLPGSFAITGGTLGGAGTVTVGALNFSNGTMGESGGVFGTTTVTGATSIDGAGSQSINYGRTLNLNGDTAWSAGNGAIYVYSGGQGTSRLNIGSGATFTDAGAASGTGLRYFGYYADHQLSNAGTYNRNGVGTTAVGVFSNTGTVNANGGAMRFDNGGSSSGSVNIAAGATLGVQGGTFSFTGGTLANAGTFSVSGGTANLNSALAYSGSGNIAVSGGLLASGLTTAITPGALSVTGGTARFAGSVNTGPLTMASGTLSGAGTVTASTLSFASGTMGESSQGFGTTTVTGASSIDGTQTQSIYYGRTLNLNGDTAWSAGNGAIYVYSAGQGTSKVNIGSGTTFTDAGAASGTGTRYIGYFGDGQINNAGTYNRNGVGTTIAGPFNNTGTLNANAGTMRFDNGGSSSSSVNVVSGATLGFQGGTFNFTGGTLANAGVLSVSGGTANLNSGLVYSGSGNIAVSGGVLNSALSTTMTPSALSLTGGTARFAGSVTTGPLTMAGGTLSGAGTVTASTLSFASGTMGESGQGLGTTTITGASSFDGTQAQYLYYGRTLNLNGDTAWSAGNSAIYVYSAGQGTSKLNIGSGTTFTDAGAASGTGTRYIGYYADGQINNAGTYNRNGVGTTIAGPFNNTGTLNANAGTMRFDNGGSSSSSVNVASGATLGFQGGTFNFTGGTLANAGTLSVSGGTAVNLNSALAYSGSGNIAVSGGLLASALSTTMSPNALSVSGGIARFAGSVNTGPLTMTGGTLGGTGTVTASTLSFASGTMGESPISGSVFGTTTITGASNFDGTQGQYIYYGRTLNLNGDTAWSAGNGAIYVYSGGQGTSKLNIGSGTTFSDAGAASGTGTRYFGYYGDSQLNNAGTYNRNGLGTTIAGVFNNTGTLNVNAGTMRFDSGGSSSGSINVAAGTTLGFQSGTFNFTGGTLANAGVVNINGGTVTVAAPVSATGAGPLNVNGGTLRLLAGGTMSPPSLNFSGGTISGPGALTAGTLNWTNGTFGESAIAGGTTTVSGAATISGANSQYLYYGYALNLNGSTNWTAGNGTALQIYSGGPGTSKLNIGAGGTFTDAGTAAAGQTRYLGYNGDGQVNIAGSYVRNGFGTTQVNAAYNNTGSTQVNGGTLALQTGGSNSGSLGVASGATLGFGGGTFAMTGGSLANDGTVQVSSGLVTVSAPVSTSGAGTLNVSGGTLRLLAGGTMSTPNLGFSGGTISGPGSLTATTLNWSGGTFGENAISGGSTTVSGAATINGANTEYIYYGHALNLNGDTTWTPGNGQSLVIYSVGQGTSKLNIGAGGTFTDTGTTAAGQTRYLGSNNDGQVNVAGSYVRSGVGITQVSSIFSNTGSVQVNGGTLNLSNGGSSSGSFGAGVGGVLSFGGGTFAVTGGTLANDGITRVSGGLVTVAAPVTSSGTGTLDVSGGTLRVLAAGSLTPANLSVSGGVVSGPGSVTAGGLNWTTGGFGENLIAGGSTTITGPATINGANGQTLYYGYTLNLNGATTWTPGNGQSLVIYSVGQGISKLNIGAGGTFTDTGTTAAGQTRYLGSNNDGQVNVAGSYVRSGVGITQVSSIFSNTGSVQVNGGTLNLSNGGSSSGSFGAGVGGVLSFGGGTFAVTGGTLANDGITRVSGGLVTVAAPVTSSGTGTLDVSGGTLRVLAAGSLTPANLSVSGGAVSGPGSVTAGGLNWTTGNFGENSIAGGSTTITGPATISGTNGQGVYYGYTLNLNGATTWTPGNGQSLVIYSAGQGTSKLNIGAGGTFTDSGTTAAGQTRYLGSNNDGQVNVAGSYVRSGVGTTQVSSIFNNTGSVQVNGGTLNLVNGGSSSGSFGAGVGGVLSFGGGTFAITGGTLANDGITRVSGGLVTVGAPVTNSGTGTLDVSGGTLRVLAAGSLTPANLSVSGGAVSGPGSVTAGGLNWTTGNFGENSIAGGSTTITGPATITGTNGQGVYYGYTLNLNGATTWTPGNGQALVIYSAGQGTSKLNIGAGGTFTDSGTTAAGQTRYLGSNTDGQVNVAGSYVRSGVGITQVSSIFNNTGITRVTGGTLFLAGPSVSNGGTFEANGGVLTIAPTSFTNYAGTTLTGGTYNVVGASTMQFNNGNVVTNAATILLDGAGSNFLNASTAGSALANFATNAAAGSFTIQNGRNFTSAGAFTNAGLVTVGSGSTFATTGAFTDQAGGTLQLAGGTFNATSLSNAGSVQGFGTLLPAVQNTGLVRASGGTLAATKGVQGSSGNVTIDAAATLDLSAATTASSAFVLADAGNLNLGAQNLVVFKDYTNTGFGSGNSFAARAGVSGTGLISGNNAAQSLTGQVTSAGANTYTLDFGNVRGGTTTTRTFQIANSGTGADIRGALQTGAPGVGSISDGRLTGSGVTAANFGAIAAGANGGNLGVTLTAGPTGGALSGQSVGVVSNFSNVATQTLNLSGFTTVLAQGLAAPAGPVDLGNFRVGIAPPASGSLNVTNTTSGAGAERLGIASATTSGNFAASNLLGAGFVAPGATQNNAMGVSTSGGVVGVNSGSVALQFTTNGQLFDPSFSTQAANTQTVGLTASGYLVAQPALPASPVAVGNFRLTTGASSAFTITNTNAAPAGYQEVLNASSGSTTAGVTLSGSFSGLAAGASSNAFTIGFAAGGSAGPRSGSGSVNLVSDGTGTSNLGLYALTSGTVAISGTAFNVAVGAATPAPVAVPNQRLNGVGGGAASVALNVANNAAAGLYSEALNASFAAQTGNAFGNGGSFVNLVAGGVNSSAMTVSVDNTVTGTRSGTVTLAYQTDGSGSNGRSGLAAVAAGTQQISVSGDVYRLASASAVTPTPVVFANQRVGGTLSQALSFTNNVANDGFSERLNATIAANGTATAGGSFNLLGAGASSSALFVGINTNTAGAKAGVATITLASDGTGTSGFSPLGLTSQTVNVSGNVFRLAQASAVTPSTVNLGNIRAGGTLSQSLTLSNLAAADGFSERLNASITATSGLLAGGSFSGLAAGSSSSSLFVGVDTTSGGARNGSATITLASDGAGTSGFGAFGLGTQVVNVTASVYRLASASAATPNPVLLANQRVGGTLTQALTLANSAATDGFSEALSATITASGSATAGGSFSLLAAGASSSALFAGVDTATAGAKGGTATIALVSDGSGSSGFGAFGIGTQAITVSGNVFRLAQAGLVTPSSVTLADQRVGGSLAQTLTLGNTAAADGFSERLNGSIAASGGAVASGSFNLLGAGASSNALSVGVNTATAGAKTGSALVSLASDGAGTSGFGAFGLTGQSVNVSGNVFRLAVPVVDTTPLVLIGRVGDATLQASIGVTNNAPDLFTERLNASIGSNPAGTNAGAALVGLLPNASGNLQLSLPTTSAGNFSGPVGVALVSSSAGTTSGAPDFSLGSVNVGLTGRVYAPAVAQVAPTVVDFGTVRVGDVLTARTVTVGNGASGALTDTLRASISGGGAPFTTSGTVASLAAGASNSTTLQVQMATGSAGVFVNSAQVQLTSQNPDLADLTLAPVGITLQGQVNNLAQASLAKAGGNGSFSGSAFSYTLNLGSLLSGSGALSTTLALGNAATGTADALAGNWDLSALGAGAFSVAGFGSFSGLAAGSTLAGLTVSFSTATEGSFDQVVVLRSTSTNGSGPDLALGDISLHLQGSVVAIPEPSTYLMMIVGVLAMGSIARRRLRARQG